MISANVGKFRYVSQKAEYRCSAKRKGKKKERKKRRKSRVSQFELLCVLPEGVGNTFVHMQNEVMN